MGKSFQALASLLRQIASVAGVVVGLIPQVPIPNATARAALIFVCGLVVAIEHYVADPSTGTPTTTTSYTSTAPTKPVQP